MAVMVWSVLFQVFFYEREEKIMAIQYDRIAKEIVEKTGGVDNILSAAHCATRLRLIVKNREIIDDDEVEKVDEVKGVYQQQIKLIKVHWHNRINQKERN